MHFVATCTYTYTCTVYIGFQGWASIFCIRSRTRVGFSENLRKCTLVSLIADEADDDEMERMLGELASIVPPSSLPVTSSLTSDTRLDREDSNGSSCKDDNSEPSNSIDRLALLRKRLEESAEPEELDSNSTTAAGGNSLTLKVDSMTAAGLEDDDDETAATINILPPTPTVPSKPGLFEHHHSANLSTEERTSNESGSGKKSLSIEDALTPRRSLATDKHSSTSGKAVSESVTVPNSSSSGSGGGTGGSRSNGSSTQGSPCFSPGAMHNSPDTNAKVQCTVYLYTVCNCVQSSICRVTTRDIMGVMSPMETCVKLTSTWQDWNHQASLYKCVPYSSHSAHSSRIVVQIDGCLFTWFLALLMKKWRNTKGGLYKVSSSV